MFLFSRGNVKTLVAYQQTYCITKFTQRIEILTEDVVNKLFLIKNMKKVKKTFILQRTKVNRKQNQTRLMHAQHTFYKTFFDISCLSPTWRNCRR